MWRPLLGVAALTLCSLSTVSPADAAYTSPVSISPAGVHAEARDQATDREGDTAYAFAAGGYFNVRIRSAGGALSPVLALAPIELGWWRFRVAVDDDGDGVAVWDQQSDVDYTGRLYARRFSREGSLGPTQQVSPEGHDATGDFEVALGPSGRAVITWNRHINDGVSPYVRTLSLGNVLAPPLQVGAGPNAMAPLIAMDRSGRATLVWHNDRLLARRLNTDGTLSPLRVIRTDPFLSYNLRPDEIGLDRRGVLTVGCLRWSKDTATPSFPPESNSYERACVLRISPTLRQLGQAMNVSQPKVEVDWAVDLGLAPNGAATIAWQKNSAAGAWVRRIHLDGTLGPPVKIASGGIGDTVLAANGDGVVTSRGLSSDGLTRIIRATTVSNGAIGTTRTVAVNDYDTSYLRTGRTPQGHNLISWNEELGAARILLIEGS
jgi:hypothetical protein